MRQMTRIKACCLLLMVACFRAVDASGQVTVSIDMDTSASSPGIQHSRQATPGQVFPVEMWLDVGSAGLSSYGVSVQFDARELELMAPHAGWELLPVGCDFNLTNGVANVIEDLGNGFGQVSTFEAVTLGNGPTNSLFRIGVVDLSVGNVVDDGLPDVIPGLFNTGIDGFFDNAGRPINAVFEPGYIVPEPSSLVLLTIGVLGLLWRAGLAPIQAMIVNTRAAAKGL